VSRSHFCAPASWGTESGSLYCQSTRSACARQLDSRFPRGARCPVLAPKPSLCCSTVDLDFGVKDLSCSSGSSLAGVVITSLILESPDRKLEFSYCSQGIRGGFSVMHTKCLVKCVWGFELFVGSILVYRSLARDFACILLCFHYGSRFITRFWGLVGFQ
jgi:hypothetical protein